MIRSMNGNRRLWPWLLLPIGLLMLGIILGSCGPSAPAPTPTPTKTPRPKATVTAPAEPTAATVATADPSPLPTNDETPTVSAPTLSAATDTPPSPTPPPPTARPPAISGAMSSPDLGMQAFLWWRPEVADRDLALIKDAGFGWVKQMVSWQDIEGAGKGAYDWSNMDRIVDQVQQYGLKLLVRVSQDPDRPFWAGSPPDNGKAFADFMGALATRYKGRIQAYQVWNEPNLAREWGNKRPDPAGYTRMLRSAYQAVKAADPNAIVVTAGMAPPTEDSERAMPDMRFYQGMYDAMGKNSTGYFDMLGVHGAGYAVAPETDPQVVVDDPKLHNNDPSAPELLRVYAFRHIEDVRNLMVRNGDGGKRMAVLEFGWSTDPDPNSPYYWHGAGAGIDENKKGDYLVRAYQWAAEHWKPWVGLMSAIYMPDVNWTKANEQYWWSVIGPGYPDLYLRPAYVKLCAYANGLAGKLCKYAPQ
jgi:polysaccharide biosynthesis protein PslG